MKQRKSEHQLLYRNWKKFDSEFIKFLKSCFMFVSSTDETFMFVSSTDEMFVSSINEMYIRFKENILDSFLPFKMETFTKLQCPFDKLLNLNRKKRREER